MTVTDVLISGFGRGILADFPLRKKSDVFFAFPDRVLLKSRPSFDVQSNTGKAFKSQ